MLHIVNDGEQNPQSLLWAKMYSKAYLGVILSFSSLTKSDQVGIL